MRNYILIPAASVTQLMVSLSSSLTKSQLKQVFGGTHVVLETERPTHSVFAAYPVYTRCQAQLIIQYATHAEWEAYILG
jgi:hypothetical protein